MPHLDLATAAVLLLNGLASASTLFIVASGLSLIFGVTRIVNFAHGSFYMLGAFVAYSLVTALPRTGAVLGRRRARRAGDRPDRGRARDGDPAPHLSRARAVPAARDLRRRADHPGRGAVDLGTRGAARPARARPARRGRDPGQPLPRVQSRHHRGRAAGARPAVAAVPPHALGHPGARRDPGPRDGRGARA